MTRAQKIIYVLGLGHSGSTVLDMLLATAGKAVGLGQVWRVLREDFATSKERVCSCGETALNCPLWGSVLEQTASLSQDIPLWSRYEVVLERAAYIFGSEIAIVELVETHRQPRPACSPFFRRGLAGHSQHQGRARLYNFHAGQFSPQVAQARIAGEDFLSVVSGQSAGPMQRRAHF